MTSHSVTAQGWYVVVEWPGPVARYAESPDGRVYRGDDIPEHIAIAAARQAYRARVPSAHLESAILGALRRGHVRTAAIVCASGYSREYVARRLPHIARRVRRGVWALRSDASPQDKP